MAITKVTSSLIESGAINAGHVTGLTSAHIAEGSNLYYTDARSRASISVGGSDIAYNSSTGVITGSRPSLAQVLGQGNSTGSAGIAFPDNQKAFFGGSLDLQIYHDGNHARINNGTGNFNLQSDDFHLTDSSNTTLRFRVDADGATDIRFNGSTKLVTTASGVNVTGVINSTGGITASHINTGQGATEVHMMNQNLRTTDDVTFDDLTVTGNLNITGDINSYNVTDLDVTDKTITLGKGQTEANSANSGIIVDGSNASFLWSEGNTRWQTNHSFLAVGNLTSYQTDNAVIMVESAGDYFPKYRVRRTGGSSKVNYTWDFILGSDGVLNFTDITNGYYPIRLTTTGDVHLGSDTSGANPTVIVDESATNLQVRDGGELRAYRSGNSAYAALSMDTGEKLRIKNSWAGNEIVLLRTGELGIGTDSPSSQLHVRQGNQALGFDAGVWISANPSDYTVGRGAGITMQNADVYTGGIYGIRQAGGWHGALTFYTHTTTSGNTFGTTFTEKMRLTHGGLLGIGTDNPLQRLHVDGGNIRINHPDTGSAPAMTATMEMYGYEGRGVGIKMRDQANNASGGGTNREWFVGTGYAQSGFNIGYSSTGSQSSYTAQNKLTITTAGLVGIGTGNPGVELDIKRTANATPLRIGSSQGEGRAIVFADVNASPTKYNWITGSQYNVDNSFEITPSTAVGGYTFNNPSMVFKQDGQVLINKTGSDVGASTNILEIDGNVRIQGGHYGVKLNNGAVERYLGRLLSNNSLTVLHDKIGLDTNNNIKFSGISQKAITIENSPASNDVGVTTFLASNNASGGLGFAANIIGVNIANTVNSNNMPTQNNTWGGVTGSAAFSMAADMTGSPANTYFRFMRTLQDSSAGTELVTVASIDKDGKFVGGGATLSGKLQIDPPAVNTPIFEILRQDHGTIPLLQVVQDSSVAQGTGHCHINSGNRDMSITAGAYNTLDKTMGLYIKTTGQVGVGMTSALNSKFNVYADGEAFRIDGSANTTRRMRFRNVGVSTGPGEVIADGSLIIKNEDANAYLMMSSIRNIEYQVTSGNATAGHHIFSSYNTEIMRIDGANNRVGIGTDNPQDKLHVYNGDIGIQNSSGRRYRLIAETNGGFTIRDQSASAGRLEIDTNGKLTVLSGNIQLGASTDYKVVKGVYRKSVSTNKSFNAIFKVNGSALGSQFRFSVVGTVGNVVVNSRFEILVNHSYDCTISSLAGHYTETKVKVVSNGNEDCTVYLGANTFGGNTVSLSCEVETYNGEEIDFDTSSPHTTAHFIHTATAGANTTTTGAMPTGVGTTTAYT